jgi:hypothetical protein
MSDIDPVAQEICDALKVRPYQIGLVPVPRRVRLWWQARRIAADIWRGLVAGWRDLRWRLDLF